MANENEKATRCSNFLAYTFPRHYTLKSFLWDYEKKFQTIKGLKRRRIQEVIGSIIPVMLRKTWCEVEFRLQTLPANHEEQMEMF